MILEVDSSLNSTLQVPICATPLVVGKPNGLFLIGAWSGMANGDINHAYHGNNLTPITLGTMNVLNLDL